MRLFHPASLILLVLSGCNVVFGVESGKSRPTQEPPVQIEGPPIFSTAAQLQAVKAKVDAGQQPWTAAYESFDADVQAALALEPVSVVDDGPRADPHRYTSDSNMGDCFDGSALDRHDYCAALFMGHASRDLAISYVMTGNDSHAQKAIELLHHWFVDSATYVSPEATNGGSLGSLEIDLWVPPFAYAASFLSGHPHWSELGDDAEQELRSWMSDWLVKAKARSDPSTFSHRFYYFVAVAAVEALLEQPDGVADVLDKWRAAVDELVEPSGQILDDDGKAGAAYFHLTPMVAIAQLSTYHGDSLYDYPDGSGSAALQRAFDYYAPCLADAGRCPVSEPADDVDRAEGASNYELSYSQYQQASHLDVLEAYPRPIHDFRILGWTTLTHGNLFELDLAPQ